jgi:predicted nucleic acid-binding Zn ribbon protein
VTRKAKQIIPAWSMSVHGVTAWRSCNVCGYTVNDDGRMSSREERTMLLEHKSQHAPEELTYGKHYRSNRSHLDY